MKKKKTKELRVFVAGGHVEPKDKDIVDCCIAVGKYLGENDCIYVQGRSDRGVMGATYREFIKHSKKLLTFDLPIFNFSKDLGGKNFMCTDVNHRQDCFLKNSDVIVVMPGGNGTIHEFATFYEVNRYHKHLHEIIMVNINGFYDKFIEFVKFSESEGFNDVTHDDGYDRIESFEKSVAVVNNSTDLIKLLDNFNKLKRNKF